MEHTSWECHRCHKVNAPHVDQCSCAPEAERKEGFYSAPALFQVGDTIVCDPPQQYADQTDGCYQTVRGTLTVKSFDPDYRPNPDYNPDL